MACHGTTSQHVKSISSRVFYHVVNTYVMCWQRDKNRGRSHRTGEVQTMYFFLEQMEIRRGNVRKWRNAKSLQESRSPEELHSQLSWENVQSVEYCFTNCHNQEYQNWEYPKESIRASVNWMNNEVMLNELHWCQQPKLNTKDTIKSGHPWSN